MLARILDFITLLLLARLLSPEDFGLVAIATSVLIIVEAVLDLPLTQALVRQATISEAMFNTAFTLGALRGISTIVVMSAAAWPLSYFYGDDRLPALISVLSIAPAARSLTSPKMVLFMQNFDFRREFAIDVVAKLSTLVFAVSISLTTGSYWALAVGSVAGPLAATTLSYLLAPMRPSLTLQHWRTFKDMIGWYSAAQILNSINWQLDRLLLPRFTSLPVFGAFSVADNLAGIPHQTFVGPLMRPLMAAFSSAAEPASLADPYLKAIRAITMVAAPILVTMAMLAEPVIRLVVGEKWSFAGPILTMLCLVSVLSMPSSIMPAMAMALDKTRYVAFRMFIEFSIRAPVTIIAIALLGLNGAIIARFTAVIVAYIATLHLSRRLIGVSISAQLSAFLLPLAPLAAIAACLFYAAPLLAALPAGLQLFFGLSASVGMAVALYWGSLLLLWHATGKPDGLERMIVERLTLRNRVFPFYRRART